jgi:TolB protein
VDTQPKNRSFADRGSWACLIIAVIFACFALILVALALVAGRDFLPVLPRALPTSVLVPPAATSGEVPAPGAAATVSPQPTFVVPTSSSGGQAPDGRIVFTCTRGGYNHICTINPDGSDLRQLTDGKFNDYYASLTPDGRQIIFSSNRSDVFQIYLMNTDGTVVRSIPVDLGDIAAPDLSPDGAWIVFTGVKDGDKSIWLVRPDGSDLHLLFGAGSSEVDPSWSPDGGRISFASTSPGTVQLFTIKPDGSDLQQVTHDVDRIGGRSGWSPDGSQLVFYAGPLADRDVFVVDIASGVVRKLTDGGNNPGPSFSPDGNWIAFSSSRGGDHELYIMRTDGSDLRQLTDNSEDDWQPRWGR